MTDPTTDETDLELRLRRAETALAESLEERGRLWQELQQVRSREADEDHFYRLYQALESSLSWKLTKPLRTGKATAQAVVRAYKRRGQQGA